MWWGRRWIRDDKNTLALVGYLILYYVSALLESCRDKLGFNYEIKSDFVPVKATVKEDIMTKENDLLKSSVDTLVEASNKFNETEKAFNQLPKQVRHTMLLLHEGQSFEQFLISREYIWISQYYGGATTDSEDEKMVEKSKRMAEFVTQLHEFFADTNYDLVQQSIKRLL